MTLVGVAVAKNIKNSHENFDEKIAFFKSKGAIVPDRKLIKTPEQIEKIRESAKVNIAVLDYVSEHIKAGISTAQIDEWVYDITTKMGAIPAPLNYEGFPKSVCTSINDQVCHGIPSEDIILQDGDIINVDASTILDGYFSDSSRMFCIGNVSEENRKLVEVAKKSLEVGLEQVKPWGYLGDMGQAIYDFVKSHGYNVVRNIGGHGIGLEFHEEPWVSYCSRKGTEMVMAPGLIFTIEPMINMGTHEVFIDSDDNWTVYTDDGAPSAQWEIQVLVTETGYEIISY
ncbi:Methionine aminopeptidase [Lachnospiraceae bacterium TWA4]|nr:Methionine aminopeptidase [Lachnospiraceae bacterium TWA4]